MAYVIGVVIFALGLLFSVCLHEAGHMGVAKALGMRVSRYFVGFGPTIFSFRRGETEYGLKAIPAGGFVSIDGMSPHVMDIPAEHERQAFWRASPWKRTAVMLAGSATHVLLAIVLLWLALSAFGIERSVDPATTPARLASISDCVVVGYDTLSDGALRPCRAGDPSAPAAAAGLRSGDVITAVNGTPTPDLASFQDTLRKVDGSQPVQLTYTRDGVTRDGDGAAGAGPAAAARLDRRLEARADADHRRGRRPALDRRAEGAGQRARHRVHHHRHR